jgi:hypothetical protein
MNYSAFYNSVIDRSQQLPMPRSAALPTDIPLSVEDSCMSGRIRVVDQTLVPFSKRPIITIRRPASFFHTMEIPLRSRHIFDWHDSLRPF